MLIPKENIIVSSEDLKLGINLKRTIVIEYYNSVFGICRVVFPFKEKVSCKYLCFCV